MSGNLTSHAADVLLDQVIRGELPPGSELPAEATLAESLDVSRLTAREALKILQSQGVVRAQHGRRGVVNPVSQWTSMEAILKERNHSLGAAAVSVQLVEMRRMIEIGAASLAAQRCTDEEIEQLQALVRAMEEAVGKRDVDAFVSADISFHDVIFRATRNEFVRLVFEPLHHVLLERRRETSTVDQVQDNALAWHRAIAEAMAARDEVAAREAMTGHMDQTQRDLQELVLAR